jgi:hypothetical protein
MSRCQRLVPPRVLLTKRPSANQLVNLKSKSVVFAGCARNCASYLPAIERNLRAIASLVGKFGLVVFENDSVDGTGERLRQLLPEANDRSITSLTGLDQRLLYRTERIAFGRNMVAAVLRAAPFNQYDFAVLLDFDDVNVAPVDPDVFAKTFEQLDKDDTWGAAFANSLGVYYDMWALRHPQVCPGDVWLQCELARLSGARSEEEAFQHHFRSRLFQIPTDLSPFPVESAFGGLGIYKLQCFVNTTGGYRGDQLCAFQKDGKGYVLHYQACEHVSFHESVRLQTRLHLKIVPNLVNRNTENLSFNNPSIMRGLTIAHYAQN